MKAKRGKSSFRVVGVFLRQTACARRGRTIKLYKHVSKAARNRLCLCLRSGEVSRVCARDAAAAWEFQHTSGAHVRRSSVSA